MIKIKIPKKLEISSFSYRVDTSDSTLADLEEKSFWGQCSDSSKTLKLRNDMSSDQLRATLCHEIVEAIINDYEIELSHSDVSRIGVGIAQALKSMGVGFVV